MARSASAQVKPSSSCSRTARRARKSRGLHRRGRQLEDVRDLGNGAPFEFAHEQRGGLVDGNLPQRAGQVRNHESVFIADGRDRVVRELDLARAPGGGRRAAGGMAKVLEAQVVGDGLEPAPADGLRPLAPEQGPVRVEEGGLGHHACDRAGLRLRR
jgi:hypothetical protein